MGLKFLGDAYPLFKNKHNFQNNHKMLINYIWVKSIKPDESIYDTNWINLFSKKVFI